MCMPFDFSFDTTTIASSDVPPISKKSSSILIDDTSNTPLTICAISRSILLRGATNLFLCTLGTGNFDSSTLSFPVNGISLIAVNVLGIMYLGKY